MNRAIGRAADAPAEAHDEEPPGAARKQLRRAEPAPASYRIGRKKPSPSAAAAAGGVGSGALGSTSVVIDLEAASQVRWSCSGVAVELQWSCSGFAVDLQCMCNS